MSTATVDPERVTLEHPDGSTSPLLLVRADPNSTDPVRADPERADDSAGGTPGSARGASSDAPPLAILVLPGVAVGARYYVPIARELAAAGVDVALTELRGQGESTHAPGHGSAPSGYHESAAEDVPLALDAMERELGPRRVVLLGHSMGAQIGLYHLARHDRRVVGLVGVAAQSPYHRGFSGRTARSLRIGSVLLPLIGLVRGSVPAKAFGGGGDQPAARIRDWAGLARSGRMQPGRADLDYPRALAEVDVPVLLVAIAGDTEAPEAAARELLRLVPGARATVELEPTELGHNRWARTPGPVTPRILDWLRREFGH